MLDTCVNVSMRHETRMEVNGVESKATVKSGEVIIDVCLSGVEEQLAKAHELVETIEKARSLADDLAKGINSIELEL